MHEYEQPIHQRPLGIDGEGNILTDERIKERALELHGLLSRLHDLRGELAETMEVIAQVSSIPYPGQEAEMSSQASLGDLIAHAHSLRVEIAELMEAVAKKSSSYYPAYIPEE